MKLLHYILALEVGLIGSAVALSGAQVERTSATQHPGAGIVHSASWRLENDLLRITESLEGQRSSQRTAVGQLTELDERIGELVASVEKLEAAANAGRAPLLLTPETMALLFMEDRDPEPPDLLFSLDYFQGRALNPELTDQERVDALESLNNLPMEAARSPAVVDAMLHLLPRIGDPNVLRDAIGHLGQVERPEFRDYLLDAASFHRSRHVREAAAIELTEFKDEPLVASLLDWLATDDPDRGVRIGAKRALDGAIYGNL